jgi:hypothetical protein
VLGSHDQVAFVFAIFVVHDDDHRDEPQLICSLGLAPTSV